MTEKFFDEKIREYIHRYNYTYNPDGVYRAIKYMYTYWPDPKNTSHIRDETINVKMKTLLILRIFICLQLFLFFSVHVGCVVPVTG